MQVFVCATEEMKKELCGDSSPGLSIQAIQTIPTKSTIKADVLIDLLFVNTKERISELQEAAHIVIINSVTDTLSETHPSFIRINGWPSFLKASLIEASALDEHLKAKVENLFRHFNKELEWLPDEPGFISPRVISMIINEAYFALSEGVSTREEIDTAMKLGTAYPNGPFEWASLIGLDKIAALLLKLNKAKAPYTPSAKLLEEALHKK